jgi:hypothetical protein
MRHPRYELMQKMVISFFLVLAGLMPLRAQDNPDTLTAAIKIDTRTIRHQGGEYHLDPVTIRHTSSPLGIGDAIKLIQTGPGVTMGGEGGSAYFVRGGNMGSNLMTLDGVPIYGVSHLLGLTSIFPQEAVGETVFHTGGFHSEDGNFTASHIQMISGNGDFKDSHYSASLNPFLVSGIASKPIQKDRLSLLAAVRVSPLGLEYKAIRPIVNRYQDVLKDFGTFVGDAYGKVSWRKDERNDLSFSVFGSVDRYRFRLNESSEDILGWANLLGQVSWHSRDLGRIDSLKTSISFNHHLGSQEQETLFEGANNRFLIRSALDEIIAATTGYVGAGRHSSFCFGIKLRGASFNPGAISTAEGKDVASITTDRSQTVLATLHGQWEYTLPDQFLLRLALRGNAYAYGIGATTAGGWLFHPEGSLFARWNMSRYLGIEVTLDALTQYYHTLEGIPLGWSLDMLVPSDAILPPEQALQGYLSTFSVFGPHSIRIGGYYKQMRNLVYYGNASSFFSSSQSGWHDDVKVGEGSSYGVEFLYEKTSPVLSWRTSYTWSRTDRRFPELNEGRRFPAKYDRRHVAHVAVDWSLLKKRTVNLSLVSQFTYQSGSWETIQDGYLSVPFLGRKEPVRLSLISSLNNYELPAFIRLDGGLHLDYSAKRMKHEVSLGVYNILNRHNPFMVRYNAESNTWNLISLIPIMPNISYRILIK